MKKKKKKVEDCSSVPTVNSLTDNLNRGARRYAQGLGPEFYVVSCYPTLSSTVD